MTTIVRHHGRRQPDLADDVAWLRWADGTIADTRTCPRNRLDRPHWERTSDRVDAPNATCACHTEDGA